MTLVATSPCNVTLPGERGCLSHSGSLAGKVDAPRRRHGLRPFGHGSFLTRDPEIRYTREGQATTSLSIAVNRRWQNQQTKEWEESASFLDVVCWRDLAENVALSLTKGSRVLVSGRLEQRSWETDGGERRAKVEIWPTTSPPPSGSPPSTYTGSTAPRPTTTRAPRTPLSDQLAGWLRTFTSGRTGLCLTRWN